MLAEMNIPISRKYAIDNGTPKMAGQGPLAAQYSGGSNTSTMSAINQSVTRRLVLDMHIFPARRGGVSRFCGADETMKMLEIRPKNGRRTIEVAVGVHVLNRMLELGRPISVRIA
jgi:hypothetical protein